MNGLRSNSALSQLAIMSAGSLRLLNWPSFDPTGRGLRGPDALAYAQASYQEMLAERARGKGQRERSGGVSTSGWKSKPRSAWMRSIASTLAFSEAALTCSDRKIPSTELSGSNACVQPRWR